ncbi:hypothetical protein ACH5RR_022352 [Cinchona calisaya]|uniref:ARM repeat superfamily protein n=1 Tax=Cinchona calisaya TaxID=153742 RepID=A0ABD2Z7K3_9GENT
MQLVLRIRVLWREESKEKHSTSLGTVSRLKDLASSDSSVRQAAAETMVVELQAVQIVAYDKLENEEEIEGSLKLEAEKDDGLNHCASSLRYVVHRLIRGVSSSRELPVKALLDQVLEAPGLQEWFEGAIETGNPDALLLALKMPRRLALIIKYLASFCLLNAALASFSLLILSPLLPIA